MILSFPSNALPEVSKDKKYSDTIKLQESIKENYKPIKYLCRRGYTRLLGGVSTGTWYRKIAPGTTFDLSKLPGITPKISVGTTAITPSKNI